MRVVTLVLLVFWLAMAWRQYQRGDLLLAGVFLVVGVVLTVVRYRAAMNRAAAASQSQPVDPIK
ncbi:MAG: hypothetical protein JSR67_09435 [Proteobacteria bacterium]|nr:hypothetical protein [Pseudomonadota bacterium]